MVRGIALLALAATLAGACGSFEDSTIVIDLRVLAISADQPELVLDFDPMNPAGIVPQLEAHPITLRALVADPGASRRLNWDMVACPPTDTLRCDDAEAARIDVGAGVIEDPESVFAPPTGTFVVSLDVLEESLRADSLAGFGGVAIQVQLRVWPEGGDPARAEFAAKRIVVAPRVPAQRTPNSNPTISALLIDGDEARPVLPGRCEDAAAAALMVMPRQEVVLLPVEPEGVRETYVLPTFEGGVRQITENLRYSWLATAGSWSAGSTGGPVDAFGNAPELASTFRAPRETGDVRLWLVQRDERGGLAWTEYCARVGAP